MALSGRSLLSRGGLMSGRKPVGPHFSRRPDPTPRFLFLLLIPHHATLLYDTNKNKKNPRFNLFLHSPSILLLKHPQCRPHTTVCVSDPFLKISCCLAKTRYTFLVWKDLCCSVKILADTYSRHHSSLTDHSTNKSVIFHNTCHLQDTLKV
jgi:hypothetical protein